MTFFQAVYQILYILQDLASEALRFVQLITQSQAALATEMFLRKQSAFYQEREIKPRRFDDAARLSMLFLSKFFDWKNALTNVKPETFLGWHGRVFRLFWRWKSRGGRPKLPKSIRLLNGEMAANNPTWGQKRVAAECGSNWESWCHRER